MKFEFSLAVKAAPMVDCHISLDCSTDELALLINDPAYQGLVKKLIDEVSFAPKAQNQGNRNDRCNDRNGHRNGKVQDHHRDCQAKQNEAIKKVLKTINTRFDAMKRNGKPEWGEL